MILSGPQFAERFALRSSQYCWLLGAGASASAGIPTGYMMIADFKKRLFCQQSGTPFREVDANDPMWLGRINQFFAARATLPPTGDPLEYARAFEAVYPTKQDRRQYIATAIQMGTPSFGHRVLAALLTSKRLPCVFTTNFDALVENATTIADSLLPAADRVNITVAAIDNPDRATRCLAESAWPLLAKLHGDFQSVELKNTDNELREPDTKMRAVLKAACERFGLIVVGYSGRDESVMQVLTEVCASPGAFPAGIYWVTSDPIGVLPRVAKFMEDAKAAGIDAAFVHSENFDEFAGDIAARSRFAATLEASIYDARPTPVLAPVPLPTHERHKFPVLQCSAIPILDLPHQARLITVSKPITTRALRDILKEKGVYATVACQGHEVTAFGVDAEIQRALEEFGPRIIGYKTLNPDEDSCVMTHRNLLRSCC